MLDKVVYQIYPKSFKDTTGNGIGDINGIIEKLEYIKSLNVDYIWVTPMYVSPQVDNGYDVADYYKIDPLFGTFEDLEVLISEAKKLDIYIMMDMVFNHVSTEHEWFQKALSGDQYYKDFFILSDYKTNWVSKFGGNAWEYNEQLGCYYLHLFDKTQADLNWENENVRNEIYKIVNFWINTGIKGFRFDVINLISKHYPLKDGIGEGKEQYTDGPRVHEFLRELRKNTFKDDVEFLTVGEMSSTTIENCASYASNKKDELDNVFHFHHLKVDYENLEKWSYDYFDFSMLKNLMADWQEAMYDFDCTDALFWSNHDQPRVASRFIKALDTNQQVKKAKMLATNMYLQRGVNYIYQGEEIGMENLANTDINQFVDVETLNFYQDSQLDKDIKLKILNQKSRDNGRTPMQWNANDNTGFTSGTPWVIVNNNYQAINVLQQEEQQDSILNYYRDLLAFKKANETLVRGNIKFINKDHDTCIMYERQLGDASYLIVCNYYNVEADLSMINLNEYEYVFGNVTDCGELHLPFSCGVLKKKLV